MGQKQSHERLFLKAKVLIESSLTDKTVLEIMSRYGYPKARIEEGDQLLIIAEGAYLKKAKEHSGKTEAMTLFKETFEEADEYFAKIVKLARIALGTDKAALEELGIKGQRKKDIPGWIMQTEQFYSHALASSTLRGKLATCGIIESNLLEGYKQAKEVKSQHVVKEQENGEAQMATKQKDMAVKRLEDWYRAYRKTAKLALSDVPQLMEKLGITERS